MKKTRLPRQHPKPIHPSGAEREYLRFLNQYVSRYEELMRQGLDELVPELKATAKQELPTVRKDADINKQLIDLFDWVSTEMEKSFSEVAMRRWASAMIGRVNKASKRNTLKPMKAASRLKDKEVPDFEPLLNDKGLSPFFQNIVDENVGLIKSITERRLPTFKNSLVSLISQDATHDTIRKAIMANFGATRSSAALIARDQVGKLNGALNEYRQKQLGGKRYVWRSGGDQRERPDHRRLNNTIQKWSAPPIVNRSTGMRGHPGQDIQCRCWAEMVLDDVLD